jgi:transcriptional regulatory protein LEU3
VYEYSRVLFWTVVYVGARKYPKDPTIVESLIKPLAELIWKSLSDPGHAIPTIQAVLILCLWPLPVDSTFKDQINAISGAAMQLAIQKGLPYASREQDFVPVALKQFEGDTLLRARLWMHCVVIFQRCVCVA